MDALNKYLLKQLRKDVEKLLAEIKKVESEGKSSRFVTPEVLSLMIAAENTYAGMLDKFFMIYRKMRKTQK